MRKANDIMDNYEGLNRQLSKQVENLEENKQNRSFEKDNIIKILK